jgi:hypothetical protein
MDSLCTRWNQSAPPTRSFAPAASSGSVARSSDSLGPVIAAELELSKLHEYGERPEKHPFGALGIRDTRRYPFRPAPTRWVSAFCLLSLLSPDNGLLDSTEKLILPGAGPVSFFGFMLLGPSVLSQ